MSVMFTASGHTVRVGKLLVSNRIQQLICTSPIASYSRGFLRSFQRAAHPSCNQGSGFLLLRCQCILDAIHHPNIQYHRARLPYQVFSGFHLGVLTCAEIHLYFPVKSVKMRGRRGVKLHSLLRLGEISHCDALRLWVFYLSQPVESLS